MRYVLKVGRNGCYHTGGDSQSKRQSEARKFTDIRDARRWIKKRILLGCCYPDTWKIFRLVPRKPKKVEIFGTITGAQWTSEDGTYINVVSPFLQEHAGRRIKVTYELC